MDYRFEIGDFDSIFTDHERAYTDNPNIPLVEQILLRFGFTQEELKNIDGTVRMKLTKEIKKHARSLLPKGGRGG